MRMWDYDPSLWTCKRGHRMSKDAVQPPAELTSVPSHIVVPVPKAWQDYRIGYALAAFLAVVQVLEVLL